jgi:ribonuclease HI
MVRNIPVPTYGYTLRLYQRNLPRRTVWGRAGPGQQRAREVQDMVAHLPHQYQSAEITWVQGHAGTPGNERADALAGRACKDG